MRHPPRLDPAVLTREAEQFERAADRLKRARATALKRFKKQNGQFPPAEPAAYAAHGYAIAQQLLRDAAAANRGLAERVRARRVATLGAQIA